MENEISADVNAIESSKKIDDETVEIETSKPNVKTQFTLAYLKGQRASIEAMKSSQNNDRDAELAQIDLYIAECTKLGIKE